MSTGQFRIPPSSIYRLIWGQVSPESHLTFGTIPIHLILGQLHSSPFRVLCGWFWCHPPICVTQLQADPSASQWRIWDFPWGKRRSYEGQYTTGRALSGNSECLPETNIDCFEDTGILKISSESKLFIFARGPLLCSDGQLNSWTVRKIFLLCGHGCVLLSHLKQLAWRLSRLSLESSGTTAVPMWSTNKVTTEWPFRTAPETFEGPASRGGSSPLVGGTNFGL